MFHSTLDLAATIVTVAVIVVDLVALTQALSGSLIHRLTIAAVVGGWVGLVVFLGGSGQLAFSPNFPAPLIGILFAMPLLAVGVLALTIKKVRAALLGIPLELLIALNAMRILGVIFLLDYIAGSLNGPFPFFAGLGDMITGALAISLALRIAGSKEPSVRTIAGWNAFGVLDLIVAVVLGITSAAGSPLQLIHAGVGSQAMQHLPLCLVPTVLVPFYLLTHAIVAAQLRARSRSVGKISACATQDVGIG
ncbi:MAG TPA: hypothetical protein VHY48_11925 [Acidobacteriaceae bacterium]|jgi:hypothetical protein|nr:hypothetical protein [Acidobacteriaceae bacterium]